MIASNTAADNSVIDLTDSTDEEVSDAETEIHDVSMSSDTSVNKSDKLVWQSAAPHENGTSSPTRNFGCDSPTMISIDTSSSAYSDCSAPINLDTGSSNVDGSNLGGHTPISLDSSSDTIHSSPRHVMSPSVTPKASKRSSPVLISTSPILNINRVSPLNFSFVPETGESDPGSPSDTLYDRMQSYIKTHPRYVSPSPTFHQPSPTFQRASPAISNHNSPSPALSHHTMSQYGSPHGSTQNVPLGSPRNLLLGSPHSIPPPGLSSPPLSSSPAETFRSARTSPHRRNLSPHKPSPHRSKASPLRSSSRDSPYPPPHKQARHTYLPSHSELQSHNIPSYTPPLNHSTTPPHSQPTPPPSRRATSPHVNKQTPPNHTVSPPPSMVPNLSSYRHFNPAMVPSHLPSLHGLSLPGAMMHPGAENFLQSGLPGTGDDMLEEYMNFMQGLWPPYYSAAGAPPLGVGINSLEHSHYDTSTLPGVDDLPRM